MNLKTIALAAVALTFLSGARAWDDAPLDRSWHLLTITYGGTVTLLKDLTKHECEFVMHRAKGEPATEEEITAAKARAERIAKEGALCQGKPNGPLYPESAGGSPYCLEGSPITIGTSTRMTMPGDIKSAECFQ